MDKERRHKGNALISYHLEHNFNFMRAHAIHVTKINFLEILATESSVTGHFVPRSFRTQVISYHFGHFVPTFIFNLVISYPVWSFRSHFVPSLVISYLLLLFSRKPFWSFVPIFLLFRTQVISYPKSFRTHFSHFVPRSFRTHF